MAMGTRRKRERQQDLWIASKDVVETPANAFYDRLNQILDEHKFDAKVERLCSKFYKKSPYGRPSMAPGVYFRSLLIGYFEGLDSERGIAWRTADSLSLRKFLGYALDEATPDHSTISRTRRLFLCTQFLVQIEAEHYVAVLACFAVNFFSRHASIFARRL